MERPVIFLDDGGVLNDNRRRGPQWQRHAADYLAAIAGFSADPAGQLQEKRSFLRLNAWLLAHPDALLG